MTSTTLKIDPDRLVKEELEFEISLRGINPTGNVTELASILRSLLKLESEGQHFTITYDRDPETELVICQKKVEEIEKSLLESVTNTWQRKVRSKLGHVLNRIEHIQPLDKKGKDKKSELLAIVLNTISQLTKKIKTSEFSTDVPPIDFAVEQKLFTGSVSSTPKATPNIYQINASSQQNPTTQSSTSMEQVTDILKNLNLLDSKFNMKNFGIKFSGNNSSLSFNVFFERIQEIASARGITKDFLFRCASELFEGEALIYFRAVRDQANSWEDLMKLFRDEYFRDGDRKIFEQIKSRTQGEEETIAIYIAKMQRLFSFLSFSVDEKMKLEMIRSRLRPEYQLSFGLLENIDSINELIALGRKFEDTKRSVSKFVAPHFNENAVELDLEYTGAKKKLDNINLNKQVKFSKKSSVSTNEILDDFGSSKENSRRSRSRSSSKSGINSRSRSRSRENFTSHCCNSLGGNERHNSRNYDNSLQFEHQHSRNSNVRPSHFVGHNSNNRYSRDRSFSRNRNQQCSPHQNQIRHKNEIPIVDTCSSNLSPNYCKRTSEQYTLNVNAKSFENVPNQSNSNVNSQSFNSFNKRNGNIVCFKCNGLNHFARNCTSSIVKCFSCGLVGFTKKSCPKCSLN